MSRSILQLALVIVFAWGSPSVLHGQELQEGEWMGTSVNLESQRANPRPRAVSMEVKKVSDPHRRWRPGHGELLNVTFVTRGGRSPLADVQFNGRTLSYTYRQEDLKVSCSLSIQAEGAFEGDCLAEDGSKRHISLNPPKDEPTER